VLYDGECGLCNGFVQNLLKYDRRELFDFASLQSRAASNRLSQLGALSYQMSSVLVIANYAGGKPHLLDKSKAALFILGTLGCPWRALGIVRCLPIFILDRLYDVVAKNRNRASGRSAYCSAPSPNYSHRFLKSAEEGVPKAEVRE
jgi:predicted DCC family thiol-disulfide oxidoreductase YuxK